MKKRVRYLMRSLFFVTILLSFVFLSVACNNQNGNGAGETDGDTTASVPTVYLTNEEISKGQIVYPAAEGDSFLAHAQTLADAIEGQLNITLSIVADDVAEKEIEILLGDCVGREESVNRYTVRSEDYGYAIDGKKIVFSVSTAAALEDAVDAFIASVINSQSKESDLFFSDLLYASHQGSYQAESILLAGSEINEYVIVYPSADSYDESACAAMLAEKIAAECGYFLPVLSEWEVTEEEKMILIGSTIHNSSDILDMNLELKKNAFHWSEKAGRVTLISKASLGYLAGIDAMAALIHDDVDGENKNLAISLDEPITGVDEKYNLCVMSFNIYYKDLRPERMASVVEMIKKHAPDTMGLQEVTPEWRLYLIEQLGDTYEFLGVGRDGGDNGEYSPVMYRKDKFTLIEEDTFWLSDTPLVPSKYSESSLNRIFTYAILKRNSDGVRFVHINTHLEHKSAEARTLQVAVLKKQIEELGLAQYPMFLTGDMNAWVGASGSVIPDILSIGFSDSMELAENKKVASTYPAGKRVIDFCFVTKDDVNIMNYWVDGSKINGEQPSDHNPVIIDLMLK